MTNHKFALIAFATLAAFGTGPVTAADGPQPKMQAALDQLKISREYLKNAEADKGGHRRKAMELVDAAIAEVEKGIIYKEATRK